MSGKNNTFNESLYDDMRSYRGYLFRLREVGLSRFEWKNLPMSVSAREMELSLFENGTALFFKDDVTNEYLCLPYKDGSDFNVYGVPNIRRAYSRYSSYQIERNPSNSVVIYNNRNRLPNYPIILDYAKRLYDIDVSITVNAKAQKTPVLIQCDEKQRLTLVNVYKQYEGNAPVIYGGKNLDLTGFKTIDTTAPYVADKLQMLKSTLYNEAMEYLGVANVNYEKKERLTNDEIQAHGESTQMCRFGGLKCRKEACRQINEMFGLNVDVDYSGGELNGVLHD